MFTCFAKEARQKNIFPKRSSEVILLIIAGPSNKFISRLGLMTVIIHDNAFDLREFIDVGKKSPCVLEMV
jgi:hypothetical protein